jgi:hypothetical protein
MAALEEKPAVKLLPFHLEGRHRVRFDESMTAEELRMTAEQQRSEFTAWMEYNRTHDDGNLQFRYQDFPARYVYDGRSHQWRKRKRERRKPLDDSMEQTRTKTNI